LLLTSYSASINAQNLDPATGLPLTSTDNLMGVGGGLPWTNTVTGAAGGYSGGSRPAYNPNTGNIIFGYTTQTVSQTVGIASALASAGAGVQLSGYRYQWQINNDLQNSGGNRGTLTGNVSLKGSAGNVLESFDYNYNQNYPGFTVFSGTQFFNNRYDTATASSITLSFTGKDQNYWAGYYGPRVNLDNFSLLYTVDPCKSNPAYSPTCSGFSNIVTSGNLSPDPNISANSLTQVVAINTALKSAGFGATVHGFNYKFDYNVGQGFFGCTATNQDGSCSWYMSTPASVRAVASMTDSSNQTLISRNHSLTGDGTSGTINSQLLLSNSMNQTALGNIRLTGGTSGIGSSIGNYSMSLIYTPDPCAKDPLYSSQCSGFAQAMAAKLNPTTTTASTPVVDPATVSNPSVVTVSNAQSNNSSKLQQDTTTAKTTTPSKTVAAALSTIAKNQQREQAIQTSAVMLATNEAAASGERTQQQAVSVVAAAVSSSQPSAVTASVTTNAASTSSRSSTSSSSTAAPTTVTRTIAPTAVTTISVNTANTAVEQAAPQSPVAVAATVATTTTNNVNNTNSTVAVTASRATPPVVSSSINFNTIVATESQVTTAPPPVSVRALATTTRVQDTVPSSILPPQPPANKATTAQPVVTTTSAPATTAAQNNWTLSQSSAEQQATVMTNNVQPQSTMFYGMVVAPLEQQQPQVQALSVSRQAEIEQVNNTTSFMTNRTDPLNEVVEAKPTETTGSTTESNQTVKANVSENELAGGVDISKMATTPAGYTNYTNLILQDGKMYEPREIYKNQKTVDNARALRQLSTDRLHQQMIEQQYRR